MTTSVSQILSEARIDPMSPETAEAVQVMDVLNQLHGRNPQPSVSGSDGGFLRDWWGTFWQMYQAKLSAFKRVQSTGGATSPSPNQPMDYQAQAQVALANKRSIILNAMQSIGLGGRDPQTLTPDEQRMVTMTIQQLQMQHFQRMQVAGTKAVKSPNLVPNSQIPTPGQDTTPSKKRKATETPSTTMTPQQMLQMRAVQFQQQQMMMMMAAQGQIGSGSRIIMPGPSLSTQVPITNQIRPASKTPGSIRGSKSSEPRSIRASPQPQEMDESALLSFFGTPQDWFATEVETQAVIDQYGNIRVPKTTDIADQKISNPSPQARLPLDTLALGITMTSSPSETLLESPRPEVVVSDPNDLLLVTETNEIPPTEIKTTESGYFLKIISSLGQHQVGTKAVSASFSHDGVLLASGGHDKRILLFSVPNRSLFAVLEGHHSQQITQVRFAPCGRRRLLASSSFDKTIIIWDLGLAVSENISIDQGGDDVSNSIVISEVPLLVLKDVHEEPIWSIDFVPSADESSMRLCSIDAAGKLVTWDLETGIVLHTAVVCSSDDRAVTIRQIKARPSKAANMAMLAIANGSNVELFDCDKCELVGIVPVTSPSGDQKSKAIVAINWGDSGSADILITTTSDNVCVWDITLMISSSQPAQLIASHSVPADKITCCSLLTDKHGDKRLVLFGGYQNIYIWEFERGNLTPEHRLRVMKFPAHEGLVVSLPITRSGPQLIGSASHDGWVKLWNIGKMESNPRDDPNL